MAQNPELYPDARRFNPGRWLDPASPVYKEPLTQYPNLMGYLSFGFGRRACPGINFTQRALVIGVARIFWAFNVRAVVDPATKRPLPLEVKYEPVPNSRPYPFPADYVPRSQGRIEVVRRALREAEKNGLVR